MKSLEIFRTGRHQSMSGATVSFSEARARAMVDAYDPKIAAAPIVKGHPETDQPAYGWIASLSLGEDDVVRGTPDQVDEQFAADCRAGRYKYISAAIYLEQAPGNPVPGSPYLKHVGMLGAAAPAVKGLKPAEFAQELAPEFADQTEGVVTYAIPIDMAVEQTGGMLAGLMQRLREYFIEREDRETADRIIPAFDIEAARVSDVRMPQPRIVRNDEPEPAFASPPEDDPMPDDNTPTADDLAAREQRIADREAALDARIRATRTREHQAFADRLVESGSVAPTHRAHVVGVLDALAEAGTVSFAASENETVDRSPSELFSELLEAGIQTGDRALRFGEFDPNGMSADPDDVDFQAGDNSSNVEPFAMPRRSEDNGRVDRGRLDTYRRIELYAQQHGIDFDEACDRLGSRIAG